jgi:hypothetical protein
VNGLFRIDWNSDPYPMLKAGALKPPIVPATSTVLL